MTRAVLLDLGGVLETGCWPGTARAWAPRLGITTGQVLAAVFGGSDDTVLTGQMSEDDWWQQVRLRLGITPAALGGLRADIAARWCWDEQLVACLDGVRGQARTAIVSNAWPHARARLDADGVAGLVDAVVLWSPACPVPPARNASSSAAPHRSRQNSSSPRWKYSAGTPSTLVSSSAWHGSQLPVR